MDKFKDVYASLVEVEDWIINLIHENEKIDLLANEMEIHKKPDGVFITAKLEIFNLKELSIFLNSNDTYDILIQHYVRNMNGNDFIMQQKCLARIHEFIMFDEYKKVFDPKEKCSKIKDVTKYEVTFKCESGIENIILEGERND